MELKSCLLCVNVSRQFYKGQESQNFQKVQKYNKLSDDNSNLDAEHFILTTHIVGLDMKFLSTKQKN